MLELPKNKDIEYSPFPKELISITKFADRVLILNSKAKPKKVK
jgi:hypothetical protein